MRAAQCLVTIPPPSRLAKADSETALLIALLGGEAGLRCGEIMALEWSDVDLAKRQLSVARSEWKGHVTATKGGRVRHVPMTGRLTEALRQSRSLKGTVCCGTGRERRSARRRYRF